MDGPDTLAWSFNPWRDRRGPRHPAVALLLLLGLSALAGYSFSAPQWWPGMLPWAFISLVALIGMCASLFLPVRYQLDDKGVTVWFLGVRGFRPWAHYRNFYLHDTGAHLTTLPTPSALDPFRGHMLLFNGNRAQVAELLARHIKRSAKAA